MLWFSGIMVVIFGGLTLLLHDETFIKIKPTIYYLTIAGLLLFGLKTGRNLLKVVLGAAYPGLQGARLDPAHPQLDRLFHLHGDPQRDRLADDDHRHLGRLQIVGVPPGDLPLRRRQRADAAEARPRRRDAGRSAAPDPLPMPPVE